ncbi:8784_t:CDS:2 [Acaulospora morrowiae]|uniref:Aldehyde dehydrogenase n=1 Tax=Acaulospora morrowiae TaxID=94023 RepID=A0A9N9C754_9GLOM|nr:8784_t:CDS:2 [Acaulospora morrowiae]
MQLTYTNTAEYSQIIDDLRKSFTNNLTKSLSYRKRQLRQLYKLLEENEDEICDALYKDLRRPKTETMIGEISWCKKESLDAIENLDGWSKPEYVKVGIAHALNGCHIRREPAGTVLIIGAWNYPVLLLLAPFIGAISAGCTVILKPSEVPDNTSATLTKLISKYLDQNAYRVVNGGSEETMELLQFRFDHIFYTGSGRVGKIIMTEAAKHLTPVTLELGGKSPAIIAKDADIPIVARRLIWGKTFNCGQTCVAPDYIICERSVQEALIKEFPRVIKEFLGENPQKSKDYSRIINQKQFDRLNNMLKKTSGKIIYGGITDRDELYISPTIVSDVTEDDELMQHEIFGPIFPIMVVNDLEEALEFVRSRDIPLAIYPFSRSDKTIQHVLDNTRSGATVINDCLMQASVMTLPFGGQGHSGMGSYRGKRSYDVFTHERSVMNTPYFFEKFIGFRYPPYTQRNDKIANWLFFSRWKGRSLFRGVLGAVIVLFLAYYSHKSEKLVGYVRNYFS